MREEAFTGGCSCGAVRYEVRGEPLVAGLCHCISCRKETGSSFLAYADWPAGAFSYTGAVRTYEGRSFCPTCGSRLFHLGDDGGAEICLGTLDAAPTGIAPAREGWIDRREAWLAPVPGATQHRKDL